MAICNRFNTLQNPTGNFLTFSQYTEDLTKSFVHKNTYKVVPSKFIAMEVYYGETGNEQFPKFLEEYFENGVARAKNTQVNYTPEMSKSIFWNAMREYIDQTDSNSIRWIGDINIHSHNTHDGMGYSEIYCHIPSDAKKTEYDISFEGDLNHISSGEHLEGYPDIALDSITYLYDQTISFDRRRESTDPFTINTIVVLYDVVGDDGEVIHQDIPMGIYLTGLVEVDGSVSNSFTKYSSNNDAYGAGTSYGLKICSRYVVSTGEASISVSAGDDRENAELSMALSSISETVDKMNSILEGSLNTSQNYKDLYALFKNSRTNVPYIKNVNGENYWFVNGKMLNKATVNGDSCECYDLQLTIDDNIILLTDTTTSFHKELNWVVKAGDVTVTPSTLYLNGVEIGTLNPIGLDITNPSDVTRMEYKVKAEIEDKSVEDTARVSFVWPSYFGLINNSNVPSDIPASCTQLTQDTRVLSKTYTNTENKHICYAYPKSFGSLVSITDSRDIEYINDFDQHTTTITYNGSQVDYYVYIDKCPANVVNYTLKFR